MNRLDTVFRGDRKALVAYLCVGDPSVEESVELARTCAAEGADILELGVPFSDPTADGPAIARASHRAIAAGGGFDATLRAARAIRALDGKVGLVLFGYYNPLFVRGEERAAREVADAGVDALLVVDLPLEESQTLADAARAHGVGMVPLLAPTSKPERVAAAAAASKRGQVPFVYYVSLTGVTGSAALDAREASLRAQKLRDQVARPVVVGFGIDTGDKARVLAAHTDGVVAGTALVRAVEQGRTPTDRRRALERLVRELRMGIDTA